LEEISWRQKFRAFWLRERERLEGNNNGFSLMVDDSVSSDSTKISEHILQFYICLCLEQFSWRPKLDGLPFNSFVAEETMSLERAFEESEVFEVVKALKGDKASSPDSFSLAFFQ